MNSTPVLFTIGYEDFLDVDDFAYYLHFDFVPHYKAKDSLILDVRLNPISRKKGFNKRSLSHALSLFDEDYLHESLFGCPKEIRDSYKKNKDWSQYRRAYNEHLDANPKILRRLAQLVQAGPHPVILTCFENDASKCHRSILAERLKDLIPELYVNHIDAAKRFG